MIYDIIIIGAGTAGLTASIYARRAGKNVLVIESETFGGQIVYSPCIENYPGFSSISGNAFADALQSQAEALGAEMDLSAVTGIGRRDDGSFLVRTEYGNREARSVIIATGAAHKKLGVDREDELAGSGVSYCALCDGAFYKGRDVAVVGGGDTACQEAVFLAGICRKVYVIHRRNEFRAERNNVEKLSAFSNIELCLDSRVETLLGDGELTGVTVVDVNSGSRRSIDLSGLFVAVGQAPATAPFKGLVETDAGGYIIADESTRTSVPGLFAAGDVRTKSVRQLATAAGDGAVAATMAVRFLG